MLKIDRHQYIEKMLLSKGSVLISVLSEELSCSEETIRRDLKEMEMDGKLRRIHGGAYRPETFDRGVPSNLRETLFTEEKNRIADACMQQIQEHEVLMLDASTTCLTLAKKLFAANLSVSILTNSLRICEIFAQTDCNIKVVCFGGYLSKKYSSFYGPTTVDEIRRFIADKSFISCPSVDFKFGLQDNNLDASSIRLAMIEQSRKRFLIVDHTKFKTKSDVIIAPLSEMDVLVTDKSLNTEQQQICRDLDLDVVVR